VNIWLSLVRRIKLMTSLDSVTLMTDVFSAQTCEIIVISTCNLVPISHAKSRFRKSSCIVWRILANIGNANVMVMRFNLLAQKKKTVPNLDTIENYNVLLTTHVTYFRWYLVNNSRGYRAYLIYLALYFRIEKKKEEK